MFDLHTGDPRQSHVTDHRDRPPFPFRCRIAVAVLPLPCSAVMRKVASVDTKDSEIGEDANMNGISKLRVVMLLSIHVRR